MDNYVELHCHSNYSLLDGASHPEDLVARAKELGMNALAITDHDGLYGAVRFSQAAIEEGIKPIIGAELTLTGGAHLLLLAKNRQGYSNLCRLITAAHLSPEWGSGGGSEGENDKRRKVSSPLPLSHSSPPPLSPKAAFLDPALLASHSAGLICLSGCRQGEVVRSLLAGNHRRARKVAEEYLKIFGVDSFWIEIQHHLLHEDDWLCDELEELADRLGIGCVATNDVHYATQEGHRLQDILVCIKNRTSLDASAGLLRPNSEYHLKSAGEMEAVLWRYPGAVANSRLIADQCDVDLNFKGYRFPGFTPPLGESAFSYLYRLCHEGARELYRPITPAVSKQLAHELDVIHRTGLAEYFLIVWDIMRHARENGIPGQGRGSAADSIVAYVLGITKVDPIRHNLLFERFLSEEMTGMPDIDIDFSTNHREQIIQYVYEKYGQEHTGMVCNVVTYRARNALREVGKALGLPPDLIGRFAKAVNRHSPSHLEEEMEAVGLFGGDGGQESGVREDDDLVSSPLTPGPWHQLLEYCKQIEGFPRHLSIHVGGMLITSSPLVEIAPLERATAPGRVVVQFNKDDVEDMGLIKMDLLGLRTLSVIHDALEMIRETRGKAPDLDRISLDDPAVYDMLCESDNIGVFQVESRAQSQTLPKMRPRSIEDLIVEISIIRPGPLQGNMVHPYLRRRQGVEEVTYLHPSMEPALKETLGVVLFQEQVIRVAVAVAGFTAGEADLFRRAMNRHRSGTEMAKIKTRFIAGSIRNGLSEETAEAIFKQLAGFASYGFCKSHAAAFAKTAYDTAYLKLYYAPEFYTAILNNQPMGFYSPEVVANDAKRHGIPILSVDVNRSRAKCTVERTAIRLGFSYVHGLGEAALQRLEEERAHSPYASLSDFLERTRLPREPVENLISVGAMDCFGRPRREMLWEVGLWGRGDGETGRRGDRAIPRGSEASAGSSNRGIEASAGNRGENASLGSEPNRLKPRFLESEDHPDSQDSALDTRADRGRAGTPALPGNSLHPSPFTLHPSSPRPLVSPSPRLSLTPAPPPPLPLITPYEETAAEYSLQGVGTTRHAVELFRAYLEEKRVVPCGRLTRLPKNLVVKVGGLVVCEQAPPTAKGHVFLTLEDETGLANVILRPGVYALFRKVLQADQMVVVEGVINRQDGITNLMAKKIASMHQDALAARATKRPHRR